jgi:phospholipase/carboxylesterase
VRRVLVLVLVSVLVPVSASPAFALPAARKPQPLPYVEIVTGGAAPDAELPLILALHGRGDTADGFAHLWTTLPAPARVAILRAPHPWGPGQAWFLGARAHVENRPAIAVELLALADRVAATADAIRAARPTRGRPVVMGFSQGGMLAWAVAVEHPGTFAAAFPVAGFLFPEMLDRVRVDPRALPRIVAFHGDADPLVSVEEDRRGARLLETRGARIDLRVYPGVQHELPPAMRQELFAEMSRALAPEARPSDANSARRRPTGR